MAEVVARDNVELYVRFFDGTCGNVEMREMIFSDEAGVFAALADPNEFAKVGIGFGGGMWANGLGPAPDAMYEEFMHNGV